MKRALIIAAHPDDETLGCGGILSKYNSDDIDFKVIFIAEGSSCRFVNPSDSAVEKAIKDRRASALKALEILAVKEFEFYDLPCGRLDQVPILEINKIIEKVISEFKPCTVFTHSPLDANSDHKIVFNSTIMATRPGAQNFVSKLFSYEVLSSSEWAFTSNFSPNYFEKISENDILKKWEALSCYESEIKEYPFPRSKEGLKALAMNRGLQSGQTYAEAFHLVREFKI